MKTGIKTRLVWSYLLLIIITVVMFEALILFALRLYYVEGVKQTLRDQGTVFTSFNQKEILEGSLEDRAPHLLKAYDFLVDAHVQLVSPSGEILAENYGTESKNLHKVEDVSAALNGQTGYFKGLSNGEKVLTVSQPLLINQNVYGAIRLTTSMEPIEVVFKQNLLRLVSVGLFVLLIAVTISYFVANSITKPLHTIKTAAEEMAAGNFSTRILKKKDDELGRLAETLNYMAEQVEKHEHLKNEFIASVSHELRTPLTSVKGWAITLHSMSEDPFFKEGLEIISNESERLSMMLGDLLDLSSLSSGKIEYQFKEFLMNELLEQVLTQLKPRAERHGIHLNKIDETKALIKGDFNRLKQVLINLIDNSLKFTPKDGRIEISVLVTNRNVSLSIIDSGEGIPPEELQLVKEKFHKGKSTASGTGLGLAICQEIVHAHKGEITLSSTVGIGTTVEINLPLV